MSPLWLDSTLSGLNVEIINDFSPDTSRHKNLAIFWLCTMFNDDFRNEFDMVSLKSGGFKRGFVLDMANISPVVSDAGLFFDGLIGSWVDQHERDRFALSPLLSNLGNNTLTDDQKQKINFQIANSLVKEKSLSPIEANSALLAALSGKNVEVIFGLCLSVLDADQSVREMLAPHFSLFTFMGTNRFAYEDDPAISQMFRGAQLLLLCHMEEKKEKFFEVLKSFEAESNRVDNIARRNIFTLAVYGKLLTTISKYGSIPNYWDLIYKLNVLFESQREYLPNNLSSEIIPDEINGVPILGSMFLIQTQQIKKISELLSVFEFLNSCDQKLRQKLLKPFSKQEFEVDMLVAGAWLGEYEAKTINSSIHSAVYARMEEFAKSWGQNNLAVSCRKFRAIIIDE